MRATSSHRVLVTGIGAMTPLGNSVPAFWEALLAGRSGVALATRYDTEDFPYVVAAEVKGFDPRDHMEPKAARRSSRFAQFAVAAAGEVLRDSWLDLVRLDRTRVAVTIGTAHRGWLGSADDQLPDARLGLRPALCAEPCPPPRGARRAGNAFGFGGQNAVVCVRRFEPGR